MEKVLINRIHNNRLVPLEHIAFNMCRTISKKKKKKNNINFSTRDKQSVITQYDAFVNASYARSIQRYVERRQKECNERVYTMKLFNPVVYIYLAQCSCC